LIGRALAEAGCELSEAEALLEEVCAINPRNVIAPQILGLAYLLSGRSAEAAVRFKQHRLPHDPSLLAHLALALESTIRHAPAALPADWPAWPEALGADPSLGTGDPSDGAKLEPDAHAGPKPSRGVIRRWFRRFYFQRRRLPLLEKLYFQRRYRDAVTRSVELLPEWGDMEGLHLVAGIASEEAGDLERARAHLACCLELEPKLLMARVLLGRVYWRLGWLDLAEELLRGVPVEGPDDYGRHYHLALVHDALGRRDEALSAMRVALADFFMEAREFYVERAYAAWKDRYAPPDPTTASIRQE
jgi:tetratricopeptide (TPR) repeat protein